MFVTEHMCFFFFFNDTATTEIYTLSLHDALPIYSGSPTLVYNTGATVGNEWLTGSSVGNGVPKNVTIQAGAGTVNMPRDRKSTRLNSSHVRISYAVFCLKKKIYDNTHYTYV